MNEAQTESKPIRFFKAIGYIIGRIFRAFFFLTKGIAEGMLKKAEKEEKNANKKNNNRK